MYRVHTFSRNASEKASTKVTNCWSAIEGYSVKPDPWRLSLKQTNKQKQDITRHEKTKNICIKTTVDCRKSFLESIYQSNIEKTIQHVVFLKWISAQYVQSTHLLQERQRESVHKGHKLLECQAFCIYKVNLSSVCTEYTPYTWTPARRRPQRSQTVGVP